MKGGFSGKDLSSKFDVCIIGSGPAGITAARELEKRGARVALIEGGGMDWSDWSQDLYRGEVFGDPYFDLDISRLRYFGGSSGHWAGWCRALDEQDFGLKRAFPNTLWPITKSELDPFLPRACEILEIPATFEDAKLATSGFRTVQFQHSPPVRFGDKYRAEILQSRWTTLFTDTNASHFQTNGRSIEGLQVLSPDRQKAVIRADAFVLAAGGIENSRLLLWSNEMSAGQVVKNAATLGRYWIEHPQATVGEVILKRRDLLGLSVSQFAAFAPEPGTLDELEALNCTFGLTAYSRSGTKKVVSDIACIAPRLADWMAEKIGYGDLCAARLDAQWEQEPRSDNRVVLGGELDSLGIPRAVLHWTRSIGDMHTVRSLTQRFAQALAELDLGRARLEPWVIEPLPYPEDARSGSHHHMGGTRMADTPERGIVDRNCKVFGQSNLYVAGSSVFPSGGYANPTLSIVQLACRLADHIAVGHGFDRRL